MLLLVFYRSRRLGRSDTRRCLRLREFPVKLAFSLLVCCGSLAPSPLLLMLLGVWRRLRPIIIDLRLWPQLLLLGELPCERLATLRRPRVISRPLQVSRLRVRVLLGVGDRFELIVLLESLLSSFVLFELLLTRNGLFFAVFSLVGLSETLVNQPLQEVILHHGLNFLLPALEPESLRRLTLRKLVRVARLLLREGLKRLSGLCEIVGQSIFG